MQLKDKQKAANKKRACGSIKKTRYGDTIVEAVIAISIYSIVAVLALGMMNSGLSRAQKNLESTMSRLAIDTQADTLRYLYENYLLSQKREASEEGDFFKQIWETKRSDVAGAEPVMISDNANIKNVNEADSCEQAIANDREYYPVFVLNPRAFVTVSGSFNGYYGFGGSSIFKDSLAKKALVFDIGGTGQPADKIQTADLYPRINYSTMTDSNYGDITGLDYSMNVLSGAGGKSGEIDPVTGMESDTLYLQSNIISRSEGIWVFGVKRTISESNDEAQTYDFYVRTCWNAVGSKAPSTTSTVVRLYEYN